MKRLLAVLLLLTFSVTAHSASFYWKTTKTALDAIEAKADGDRAIVIESTGLMTSYYHTGGNWVAVSLMGGIPMMTDVTSPTAAQMLGSMNLITSSSTVLLPTAVAGMSGCVLDTGTAHDIIVDVQAGDDIEMDAGQQANGVGVTNASGTSTADFICVVAPSAGHWVALGKRGTWASQ